LTANGKSRLISVYVVLPQQTMLLDVAGPLEVVRAAQREQTAVRFEARYVGPAPAVSTSIGLTVTGIEPLPKGLPDGLL
jgi:transcriptional regulator GlxA family with amidase domain